MADGDAVTCDPHRLRVERMPDGSVAFVVTPLAPVSLLRRCAERATTLLLWLCGALLVFQVLIAERILPPLAAAVAALAVAQLVLQRRVEREEMLIKPGVGVQLETHWASGAERVQFVAAADVEQLLLHEFIRAWGVYFYLVLVVRGQSQLMLPFPYLQPRHAILERVLIQADAVLFPEDDGDGGGDGGGGSDDEDREVLVSLVPPGARARATRRTASTTTTKARG